MADQVHDNKLVSIQLLRALASAYVSIAHMAWAFADHVGDGLGFAQEDTQYSQIAVAVFFVVSGYIMVVSSQRLFGAPGAARAFWTRRAVRILPPYWIATAGLVFWLVFLGVSPEPVRVVQSLFFIPFWDDSGSLRYSPILWPGWTLFYELFFYFVFGLFLALGRTRTVVATSAALIALSLASFVVRPDIAWLYFITRPILLIFVFGMALALWRERGGAAPAWLRFLGLAATGPFLFHLAAPSDPTAGDFSYLVWAGIPAMLIGFAALAGPLRLPVPGLINAAGNMSYALYLIHVPMGWAWQFIYRQLVYPAQAWGFLISLVLATFVSSWIFYCYIERPMTRWLNARLAPRMSHRPASEPQTVD